MASNQTSRIVATCRCFFSLWKQIRAVETHQKLFDTKDPGWKGAIEDIKRLMGKFNNFSLFYAHEKRIIHLCDSCFEKILYTKTINFIDCVSYYALLESYKEKRITERQILPFAPRIGCIAGVVKRNKRISDICELCRNWAMQRLLLSETYTIYF